jgi:hypothetical protein
MLPGGPVRQPYIYIPTTPRPHTVDCSKIPAQAAMYSENAGYALTQPSNPPPPPHSTEPGTDNLWSLLALPGQFAKVYADAPVLAH